MNTKFSSDWVDTDSDRLGWDMSMMMLWMVLGVGIKGGSGVVDSDTLDDVGAGCWWCYWVGLAWCYYVC